MTFNYNLKNAQAIHIFSAGKYVDRDIVVNAPSLKGVLWTKMDGNNNPEEIQTIGLHTYTSDMHKTSHDVGEQMGNNYLETVIFGEGLKVIADEAFLNCTALSNVSLPDGLTTIGTRAFGGCGALASLSLPNTLTTIGEYALASLSGLTTIELQEGFDSDLDISGSPLLDQDAVVNIVNNYKDNNETGITRILTLHPDVLANVSVELNAIAFEKGLTIAGFIIPRSVYFVDDTYGSWIANDNAVMYVLDTDSLQEYEMIQVDTLKWVGYIPDTTTSINFVRKAPNQDNNLIWNAGALGEDNEYHALGEGAKGGLWKNGFTSKTVGFQDGSSEEWVRKGDAEIFVSYEVPDSNNGNITIGYFATYFGKPTTVNGDDTYLMNIVDLRGTFIFYRYVNGVADSKYWSISKAANTTNLCRSILGESSARKGSWSTNDALNELLGV